MSKGSESVKLWRNNVKLRIVEAMGGCCQICGYNRCEKALELHHIEPDKKELSFGAIRANPQSWIKIVDELRKCILLCSNCHKEFHAGIIELPLEYQTFNDDFVDYRPEKPPRVYKGFDKFNWTDIDLEVVLRNNNYNLTKSARQIGVSDNSVKKRAKKIGLYPFRS